MIGDVSASQDQAVPMGTPAEQGNVGEQHFKDH